MFDEKKADYLRILTVLLDGMTKSLSEGNNEQAKNFQEALIALRRLAQSDN